MSNNLASRQPFRSFLSQTACCMESEFNVAETIFGVYTSLDLVVPNFAFSVQPLCSLCLCGCCNSDSYNHRVTEHTEVAQRNLAKPCLRSNIKQSPRFVF